jgi:uncharacterized protein (DUF2147 family)
MRQIFLAVLAMFVFCANADAANAPLGRWLTASGNVVIEIAPCGPALCGAIVEVRANRSMEGGGEIRARPSLGMKIITDLVPIGDNEWQGHIYNRENGKTYDCVVSQLSPTALKVRPYIFVSLIGQTQIWKRVTAP